MISLFDYLRGYARAFALMLRVVLLPNRVNCLVNIFLGRLMMTLRQDFRRYFT